MCWPGVAVVCLALLPVRQRLFQVVGPHSSRVSVEVLHATFGNVLVGTCLGTSGLRPFDVVY